MLKIGTLILMPLALSFAACSVNTGDEVENVAPNEPPSKAFDQSTDSRQLERERDSAGIADEAAGTEGVPGTEGVWKESAPLYGTPTGESIPENQQDRSDATGDFKPGR